jgi:hypothetical protein
LNSNCAFSGHLSSAVETRGENIYCRTLVQEQVEPTLYIANLIQTVCCYNSNLLESLNLPDSYLSPLGFADDVNLLIYRTSTAENYMSLELGYDKCLA